MPSLPSERTQGALFSSGASRTVGCMGRSNRGSEPHLDARHEVEGVNLGKRERLGHGARLREWGCGAVI